MRACRKIYGSCEFGLGAKQQIDPLGEGRFRLTYIGLSTMLTA